MHCGLLWCSRRRPRHDHHDGSWERNGFLCAGGLPDNRNGKRRRARSIRNPGAGSRAFLLRFDVGGWLPGSFSGAATIELTNYRNRSDPSDTHVVNVYSIPDGAFGDSLAELHETTVMWNNAPGLEPDGVLGDDEDVDASSILLGSFLDGSGEGTVDSFSTATLLDFLNADSNGLVVLLLTTPTANSHGQVYASKEATSFSYRLPGEFAPGTHAPTLTFTAIAVPEPTVGALVTLGLVMIGLSRSFEPRSASSPMRDDPPVSPTLE